MSHGVTAMLADHYCLLTVALFFFFFLIEWTLKQSGALCNIVFLSCLVSLQTYGSVPFEELPTTDVQGF